MAHMMAIMKLRKTPTSFNAKLNMNRITLHYRTKPNLTSLNKNKTMSITGKITFKFICVTAMKERHHFV